MIGHSDSVKHARYFVGLIEDHQRAQAEGRKDHDPGASPDSCILCAVLAQAMRRQIRYSRYT